MSVLLWLFWSYSFLGWVLEVGFAAVLGREWRERKCFLLLPLCPVYGIGMLTVLALPPGLMAGPSAILWGGLAATAAEYAVHWWYQQFCGVQFWDYSGVPGNLHGRVCLPFSAAWGLLTWGALRWVQPGLALLAAEVPAAVTFGFLLLFTADSVITLFRLRQEPFPAALRLR